MICSSPVLNCSSISSSIPHSSPSTLFASTVSSCVSPPPTSPPVPPLTATTSQKKTRKATLNKIMNNSKKIAEEIIETKSEEIQVKEEKNFNKNILNPSVQRELLIEETNNFFFCHNIRLKKHVFPLFFPSTGKDLHAIASEGKEIPPYTTIYRHMCNLKKRILSNWSYIRTDVNEPTHPRNANIPFYLRDLTENINAQLDSMADDLNDREFTGVLLTLHTCTFNHPNLPPNQPLSKVIGGALVECLESNERCIKVIWMHPKLNAYATRLILQAFLPRVILEAFDIHIDNQNDNNCDKSNFANNKENTNSYNSDSTSSSTNVLSSSFSNTYKFVYAMHDDLDLCPRQTWLLLASSKFFYLPRHYESSETHNIILDYGGVHTDDGNKNLLDKSSEEEGKEDDKSENMYVNNDNSNNKNTLKKKNSCNSKANHICKCFTEKQKCKQAYLLERLIGCSEKYMYDALPTLNERKMYAYHLAEEKGELEKEEKKSGIDEKGKNTKFEIKKGWRDFIPKHTDMFVCHQVNDLIPSRIDEKEKESSGNEEKKLEENKSLLNVSVDWLRDEWCGLSKCDLMDVQSDVEDFNAVGGGGRGEGEGKDSGGDTNSRKRAKRKRSYNH